MTAVAQRMRKWLVDPADGLAGQVPRALVVSVLAAIVDCAVLFFLVDAAGWSRMSAAIVAYLAGGLVQYALCSCWVFSTAPANAAGSLLAFLVLSLFGLVITWLTMAVLASVHLSVAKFVALALAFSWNFLSRKYLLFRDAGLSRPPSP